MRNDWHPLRIGAAERRVGPFTLWAVDVDHPPPGVVRVAWSVGVDRVYGGRMIDAGEVDRATEGHNAHAAAMEAAMIAAEDALRVELAAALAALDGTP